MVRRRAITKAIVPRIRLPLAIRYQGFQGEPALWFCCLISGCGKVGRQAARCRPPVAQPVFHYWRHLGEGPDWPCRLAVRHEGGVEAETARPGCRCGDAAG